MVDGVHEENGVNLAPSFGYSAMFFTKSNIDEGFFTVVFSAESDEAIFAFRPMKTNQGFSVRCIKD